MLVTTLLHSHSDVCVTTTFHLEWDGKCNHGYLNSCKFEAQRVHFNMKKKRAKLLGGVIEPFSIISQAVKDLSSKKVEQARRISSIKTLASNGVYNV